MRLSFIAISLCCFTQVSAQQTNDKFSLHFQHINERDGLSNNVVHSIFKDSRGFMWIGTDEGLNLFDGSTFTVYRHNFIDTFSLQGNDIIDIAEDNEHQVWVSSHCAGLSALNPFNKKAISHNAFFGTSEDPELCDIHVQQGEDGKIWICNRKSLFQYGGLTNKIFAYPFFKAGDNKQAYNFCVSRNRIWIGYTNGLMEFDMNSNNLIDHSDWVNGNLCSRINEDSVGNLIVCTWQNGLYIIDPKTGKRKKLLDGNIVSDAKEISFDGHKQLWAATNTGLYIAEVSEEIWQLTDKSFARFTKNDADTYSLSDNNVNCIWRNDNGTVWLGTSKGIDVFDPSYLQFSSKRVSWGGLPFPTTQLNYVLAEKDRKGNRLYDLCYWHGTGFLQTDSLFTIKQHLRIMDDHNESVIISSCLRGNDGYLWLATWDGLWCYDDLNEKKIRSYKKDTPGKLHLNTNKADFVLQDKKGRFWVGTYGYGLNMLDIKHDTSYVFMADGSRGSLYFNRCDFIFEDSRGNIWVTGPALQKFNESSFDFITYTSEKGNAASLPGKVNAITEDQHHRLWLATEGGVSVFDPVKGTFHNYSTKDGLGSDQCNGIVKDSGGNIWVSTMGGLSSINIESGVVKNYTTNDGLPTNQLGNVILGGQNDGVIFSLDGDNSSLLSFNAATERNLKEIPFHFTSINILGSELLFDRPLETIDGLHLSFRQNVFTVSFKALDYSNANNIRYQCKLEGFDKSWVDLGHRGNVTYTNLDGGRYDLLVKATDAKGQWLNKELHLKVNITPPYWKTWWFYIICAISIIGIVYVIFRFRVNTIRKEGEQKAAMAKEIAALEMKALKAQMNPHFIFNALSSIQESIIYGKTEAASKYLGKFSRLIRTVLEFSDKKLITLQQEINYLTLYLELESFRFDDFHFSIEANENIDTEFIRIPPMLVQPFIENAIKHGLSHKSGTKYLTVIFEELEDCYLKAVIDDNGIGREHAAELNLGRNLSQQSMGIKITSRRLQLMNEKERQLLKVNDKTNAEGKPAGTQITLLIPIENT